MEVRRFGFYGMSEVLLRVVGFRVFSMEDLRRIWTRVIRFLEGSQRHTV